MRRSFGIIRRLRPKHVTAFLCVCLLINMLLVTGPPFAWSNDADDSFNVTKWLFEKRVRSDAPGQDIFKTFLPDTPHMLLILSYQRCGTTYFGDIFGHHPDVIYTYEPLDGVYVSLYGTMEGWNVPSDITNFKNGSRRIPSQRELTAVTATLNDLLNCRISSLPVEVLAHKFYQLFKDEHGSAGRFLKCSRMFQLSTCRKKIAKICSHRFFGDDPAQNDYCYDGIHDSHTDIAQFKDHQECMKRADKRFLPCVQKTIATSCEQKPFRAVKTVRATMASVEELIQTNPNLRIVHLLRDPRAVVLSRSYFDWSSFGFYATLDVPGNHRSLDVIKEASLYCDTVVRDISLRRELELKHPGVFKEVIYDDFVLDPVKNTEEMYQFINVTLSDEVKRWLSEHTRPPRTSLKQKWYKELTVEEIRAIDDNCLEFYQQIF